MQLDNKESMNYRKSAPKITDTTALVLNTKSQQLKELKNSLEQCETRFRKRWPKVKAFVWLHPCIGDHSQLCWSGVSLHIDKYGLENMSPEMQLAAAYVMEKLWQACQARYDETHRDESKVLAKLNNFLLKLNP